MTNDIGLDEQDFLAAIEEVQQDIRAWDTFFEYAKARLHELTEDELSQLTAIAKEKTAEVQRAVLLLTPAEGNA